MINPDIYVGFENRFSFLNIYGFSYLPFGFSLRFGGVDVVINLHVNQVVREELKDEAL